MAARLALRQALRARPHPASLGDMGLVRAHTINSAAPRKGHHMSLSDKRCYVTLVQWVFQIPRQLGFHIRTSLHSIE